MIFHTQYFGYLTLDILMASSYEPTVKPDYRNAVLGGLNPPEANTAHFTGDDVRAFSHRIGNVLKLNPHVAVFAVADDPLSFGLSQLCHKLIMTDNAKTYVVRSEATAFEIIGKIREAHSL
ncbi:MAG: hypothetical protein JXX14_09575 [Deltaproteobacteria bacterium]|nr:hypothetical protein [Deltaproteobacteria bacterium]